MVYIVEIYMRVVVDAHIHGRFSRATSKQLTIPILEKYARIKGLDVLGTGDFTHPIWIKELKQYLSEDGTGLLKTETGFNFILQTEVSLMYNQGNKSRKIHNVILAPNFEVVDQIISELGKWGRLDYDGRPIFGRSCVELVELMRSISHDIEIIPAHIWTPWFGLLGSKSGFDSIKECFQDQTKYIHALETGLSSDPEMNWRLSQLDNFTLVSNSDAHSHWPWRIGRECNIFELKKMTYDAILNVLKTKEGFSETIEFWPHEGKYHYDGHRACNVVMDPKQAISHNNLCPVCKRPLTIGVLHRVEELADREEGSKPKGAIPFRNLIPLSELLSGVLKSGVATQKVWAEYNKLIAEFGNEYKVMLDVSKEELQKVISDKIAEIIMMNREQKIKIQPGYDGVYGKPIFDESFKESTAETKPVKMSQKDLDEYF